MFDGPLTRLTSLQTEVQGSSFRLIDESPFAFIISRRGRKRLATPEEAEAYYKAHPKRLPRPPRIQVYLKQAMAWQAELDASPTLTRAELAKKPCRPFPADPDIEPA